MSTSNELGPSPPPLSVADLNNSMNRMNLIPPSDKHSDDPPPLSPPSSSNGGHKNFSDDDVINQVDQFLRDAIQNPRERLSILRMEQDVVKFINDPNQHQLEFQQLPTSYLRLAAHRVAQHYSLQSMVLLDGSLPDGSGSRIIVHKISGCKAPLIRLADIPVKLPSEDNIVKKVAIKQRPHKQNAKSDANSNSVKNQNAKSVEERTEEYSRARARIFSSSDDGGSLGGKAECESGKQDNSLLGSLDVSRVEDKSASVSDVSSRVLVESTASNSRARSRSTEMESVGTGRNMQSSRVAIFRDREVDRKDPDYDRSYERFVQRFDPGYGYNGGPYTMQPVYTAVSNYRAEFPQLGSTHGPQLSAAHHPQPLLQHIPGPWAPPPPAGLGYGYPETMVPFNPRQVGACSAPTLYLHSSQYSCHCHGMPFIPHEPLHQPFAQFHQPPPDASLGMAWPW